MHFRSVWDFRIGCLSESSIILLYITYLLYSLMCRQRAIVLSYGNVTLACVMSSSDAVFLQTPRLTVCPVVDKMHCHSQRGRKLYKNQHTHCLNFVELVFLVLL